MRILHLIPSFETGGAERQLAYLAAEMARRGEEVHVASLRDGSNRDRMALGGGRLHRLAASGNHDPRLLPRLVSLIRRVRPDIVQSWLLQMDILAGIATRICGVRWSIAERSSEAGYPPTAKNRIRRFLGGGADLLVANSEGGERYWRGAPSPSYQERAVLSVTPSRKKASPKRARARSSWPEVPTGSTIRLIRPR